MTADLSGYGPWALVVGASDGVGAAFADALAAGGLNVVLVARRQQLLDEAAAGIADRRGVRTRTVAVDLVEPDASDVLLAAVQDLAVGFLVYCAGADPDFKPFLANTISAAEAMVQRNCVVPMQLCHALAPGMVKRGAGAIVIVGSGAGFVGGPNMVAYGASKAFDMVFAEALWSELRDTGVDVIGLILGKTDTPALRRLEYERGQIDSTAEVPAGAAPAQQVVAAALDNLTNGPTVYVGDEVAGMAQLLGSQGRNESVAFMAQAITAAMGK